MTKYIDLLREHQSADKKTEKPKKNKSKKKGSSNNDHNPYSHNGNNDPFTLEQMEALLEEQDLLIGESELLAEIPTSKVQKLEQELLANTEKDDIPNQRSITEFGFDISTWLRGTQQTLTSMFQSIKNDEPINIATLEEQLSILFDQLQASKKILDQLELEINKNLQADTGINHHADLVQKSTMMMLYTIKIGIQFKLSLNELLPNVIAAMLHHIGMVMIPSEIRLKSEKLSEYEFQKINQANEHAIDYLKAHNITHDPLHLAISQSKEHFDGSGANELKGYDIAWVSRLVSMLTMFESLIHIRPYRQRLLPRDAIREIVKHHKKHFDPEMLKALIEAISLYPVGTFIQLNTGEIGQVIAIHVKFPLRPIILINMDQSGQPITEREIDLKSQPNLMIKRSMFEEDINSLSKLKPNT